MGESVPLTGSLGSLAPSPPGGMAVDLARDSSRRQRATFEQARELVMQFGWNATSYQILNPGIRHWFSAAGDAVIGYSVRHRVRVVAGAPICAVGRLLAVAAEFEGEAAQAGETVCYMCAEARVGSIYRDAPGYSRILLGSQPVWDPRRWPEIIAGKSSIRAQLHRAVNKGVIIEDWPATRAENNPALHRCLDEWLTQRGLPPLHFLVEPETLARLADRRVFVALQNGEVVGFLIASPVPQRSGWLVEQNLRGDHAPNGTTELLLDSAMRALAAGGAEFVTLGLAPLSNLAGAPKDENPLWLRFILGWLRAHGRRFFNFRGLENFKAKFLPTYWDPVYAIANEPTFSPTTLYSIAAVFSDGSPVSLIGRGMFKALVTEIKWLFRTQ